jgi:hypothetical protein
MSSNNKKNDKNKHRWYSIDSEESLPTAPDGDEYYVYPYDDTGDDNSVPSECFNYFCNAKSIGTLFARVFLFSFFYLTFFFCRAHLVLLSLSLSVFRARWESRFFCVSSRGNILSHAVRSFLAFLF